MSNNRHLISDSEIVRPPLVLEKGLPLPFMSNKYEIDEGWVAVMSVGGAYAETLQAGTHFLAKYPFARGLKAIQVNTRLNHLTVSTLREFTIAQPVPVEINLDVSVEYRVVDARRVALEINHPLTSLYDRVLQAMRGAVVDANVDEIRRQGEGIAMTTLRRLNAMRLPDTLGVEVLNVLVTSIKATDAGNDALARLQFDHLQKVEAWKLDSFMTQNSRVTEEWMIIHRPEIYREIKAGNFALLKEMIDKGLLAPEAFLNERANSTPAPHASRLPAPPQQTSGSKLWECQKCGAINPERALFCSDCGTQLLRECPKCHKNSSLVATGFCPSCGSNYEETVKSVEPRIQPKFNPKVTLAHPRLMSKRYSSFFVVKIHLQGSKTARREINELSEKYSLTVQSHDSLVKENQNVIVKLSSPHIEFSEPALIIVTREVTTASFTGIPTDLCAPGRHAAVLSLTDKENGALVQSIPFQVSVVDFAFDHVSRPLLSNTTSVVLGFGSFASFVLTFMGQIDQTFGLASGSAAGAIAVFLYARYLELFKRSNTNVSSSP